MVCAALLDRIIEPLASRCSKFRFKPLDPSSTQMRVEMIAQAEGVELDAGVSELAWSALVSVCALFAAIASNGSLEKDPQC